MKAPSVSEITMERINTLNEYLSSKGARLFIAGYPIGYGELTDDKEKFFQFEMKLRGMLSIRLRGFIMIE